MPVGGGKFSLEKTWRSSGTGSQTFNTTGTYPIPYGKNRILVSGRGGTGNTTVPSNIAAYNPSTPGNPAYNPPSGGNAAYNPYYPPTPFYNPYFPGNVVYNPVSGGNLAGYNAGTPGNIIYNAAGPGAAFAYLTFYCYPAPGGGLTIERYAWIEYSGNQYNPDNNFPRSQFTTFPGSSCPAPFTVYSESFSPGGGYAGYNSPSGQNANYNPVSGGNYAFQNSGSGGNFAGYNAGFGGNFAGYNAFAPGNFAGFNAIPGNANYNAAIAAAPGTTVNVLGVTLPGGGPGSVATVIPGTLVDTYAYPDGSSYPVVVAPGGYVTITSE